MGIKFLCPNGHKLHVKSFLAGKRAICPRCGERVLVPAESVAIPLGESSDGGPGTSLAGDDLNIDPVESAVISTVESTTSIPPVLGDPLAEMPTAMWFVRPPAGGQYGPASAEIMRSWLSEGRVGPQALVWRTGWPEWRAATAVFTQLAGAPSPGVTPPALSPTGFVPPTAAGSSPAALLPLGHAVESLPPEPQARSAASSNVAPLAETVRKRRRKNDVSLMVSAALLVISLILVIVLIIVFRNQSAPKSEDPPEAKPPTEVTLI